jgi:hypothetical protein
MQYVIEHPFNVLEMVIGVHDQDSGKSIGRQFRIVSAALYDLDILQAEHICSGFQQAHGTIRYGRTWKGGVSG